ncbi:unnamed protein product [Paramecium primaurelia]|uniref:Uncharacterized protein n=1 Tax=Paramecium primaurelia TaxID=5886 RepID=A0A8S1PQJ1_PARPR|nr:unnamed protein product [Paramecium primaurelia]
MILHFLEFILLLFHAICFVANWRLVDSRFTETQILEVNSWISKDSCTTSTVSDMLSNGNCKTNQLQKYVIYISILAINYDDGINLPCLPICGDQIIVDEDDCDDGNNDPYDGCHQCQFTFQDECQICFKNKCYHCKDNYSLIEAINTFISICGDLVIIKMNNAMMVIILNLIDVILVNSNGIIIVSIVVKEFVRNGMKQMDGIQQVRNVNLYVEMEQLLKDKQYCEDSNLYPFDLCNFCEQECSEHCLLCSNGKCLKCGKGFNMMNKINYVFKFVVTFKLQGMNNVQIKQHIIYKFVRIASQVSSQFLTMQLWLMQLMLIWLQFNQQWLLTRLWRWINCRY